MDCQIGGFRSRAWLEWFVLRPEGGPGASGRWGADRARHKERSEQRMRQDEAQEKKGARVKGH